MIATRVAGIGTYVPERRLTNIELSTMVETTDEWIVERTGIRERRVTAQNEFTSDMCEKAFADLRRDTPFDEKAIDYVVCSTVTGDYGFPSVASVLQNRLGITNRAGAIDVAAGCAGFVYGLDFADALIASGRAKNVLVFGGETLSKVSDYTDRATCVLFGDGAGVALVQAAEGSDSHVIARRVGSDGDAGKHLFQMRLRHEISGVTDESTNLRQNGREVYRWVVERIPQGVNEILAMAKLAPDELDWFVPHSANMRMIEAICKRTGVPLEKTLTSMEFYGNTSSGTIPLALAPAIRDGRVKRGQTVLVYGFGAGLVEAAILYRW